MSHAATSLLSLDTNDVLLQPHHNLHNLNTSLANDKESHLAHVDINSTRFDPSIVASADLDCISPFVKSDEFLTPPFTPEKLVKPTLSSSPAKTQITFFTPPNSKVVHSEDSIVVSPQDLNYSDFEDKSLDQKTFYSVSEKMSSFLELNDNYSEGIFETTLNHIPSEYLQQDMKNSYRDELTGPEEKPSLPSMKFRIPYFTGQILDADVDEINSRRLSSLSTISVPTTFNDAFDENLYLGYEALMQEESRREVEIGYRRLLTMPSRIALRKKSQILKPDVKLDTRQRSRGEPLDVSTRRLSKSFNAIMNTRENNVVPQTCQTFKNVKSFSPQEDIRHLRHSKSMPHKLELDQYIFRMVTSATNVLFGSRLAIDIKNGTLRHLITESIQSSESNYGKSSSSPRTAENITLSIEPIGLPCVSDLPKSSPSWFTGEPAISVEEEEAGPFHHGISRLPKKRKGWSYGINFEESSNSDTTDDDDKLSEECSSLGEESRQAVYSDDDEQEIDFADLGFQNDNLAALVTMSRRPINAFTNDHIPTLRKLTTVICDDEESTSTIRRSTIIGPRETPPILRRSTFVFAPLELSTKREDVITTQASSVSTRSPDSETVGQDLANKFVFSLPLFQNARLFFMTLFNHSLQPKQVMQIRNASVVSMTPQESSGSNLACRTSLDSLSDIAKFQARKFIPPNFYTLGLYVEVGNPVNTRELLDRFTLYTITVKV
ncbi:hypothetical protein HK096_003355 [Nowakowskiella sp. JEL0078]|nr:hypothetical protein HK096_003355 [Nowakowskiella sp. JEL0078]